MKRRLRIPQHWNRKRRHTGQGLVETAITLTTVMLPLSLGIIQYGIILNATQSLSQIAREGGRYAALHGTETNADADIKDHIQRIAAQTTIRAADLPDSAIEITMLDNKPRASGNVIRVSILYPMHKKIIVGRAISWLPGIGQMANGYRVGSTYVLE